NRNRNRNRNRNPRAKEALPLERQLFLGALGARGGQFRSSARRRGPSSDSSSLALLALLAVNFFLTQGAAPASDSSSLAVSDSPSSPAPDQAPDARGTMRPVDRFD